MIHDKESVLFVSLHFYHVCTNFCIIRVFSTSYEIRRHPIREVNDDLALVQLEDTTAQVEKMNEANEGNIIKAFENAELQFRTIRIPKRCRSNRPNNLR